MFLRMKTSMNHVIVPPGRFSKHPTDAPFYINCSRRAKRRENSDPETFKVGQLANTPKGSYLNWAIEQSY